MSIDWGILERGTERTRQQFDKNMSGVTDMIKQHSVRRAVEDYQADPKNTKALSYLYSVNPSLASSLEKGGQERAEQERAGESRSALSAWMLSGGGPRMNALSGVAAPVGVSQANSPGQPANALNAYRGALDGFASPVPQGAAPGAMVGPMDAAPNAFAPAASAMRPQPMRAPQQVAGPPSPADPAWERYVRADPSGAMKSLLEKQNLTKAQNEAMFTQMDMLGRLARGAVDQPSYEAAIQRAQSMGIDTSSLPAEFDPAAVNAVELQAMSAKEYLTEQRNDRKLEWGIEDDEFDNARDDRNVDSQVGYRQGQLGNTRRGQDLTDARGRRGQDLTDRRGRRGQDLTDSRGRRGQDITDTRGRRGQDMGGNRGRRGRGGASGGDGAVIVNPTTGQRMRLQNGQWVPA